MADRRKDRRLGLQKMFDDYVERLQNDFTAGAEQSAQGFGDIVERGNVLTGIPRIALGGLGWMGSPVSAAVSPVLGPLLAPVAEATDTYVGQPVERMTGYPADLTNEIFLSTAIPVAGSKIGKMASPYLSRLADAAETGANRAGYTFRPPEGTFFTFGGPTALTADKIKLAQAQKMAADGLSRDEIWNQTGWFQGVDGKWRFEIDDSTFSIRPDLLEKHKNANIGSTLTVPLSEAIDAPDLLSAYNLADTTLDLSRLSKGGIGGFDRANNSIELMAAPDTNMMRRGLLHEISHLIQQKEGFTGGGNPSILGAEKYRRLGGEVEARNVEARADFTPEQRQNITPWATQDVPFEKQFLAKTQRGVQRSGAGPVKLADDGIMSGGGPVRSKSWSAPKLGDETVAVYHGTGGDHANLMPQSMNVLSSGSREGPIGVWTTNDPRVASSFADFSARGSGANVRPLAIKLKNPLELKSYDEIRDLVDKFTQFERPGYVVGGRQIRMMGDKVDYDGLRAFLREQGYDGIALRQTLMDSVDGQPIDQFISLDSQSVSPRFGGLLSQPVKLADDVDKS
jgi:hypothetical protein